MKSIREFRSVEICPVISRSSERNNNFFYLRPGVSVCELVFYKNNRIPMYKEYDSRFIVAIVPVICHGNTMSDPFTGKEIVPTEICRGYKWVIWSTLTGSVFFNVDNTMSFLLTRTFKGKLGIVPNPEIKMTMVKHKAFLPESDV